MKLNQITIASLVLVAGTSFAQTAAEVCKTDTKLLEINSCQPEVTFFIAGASALGDATALVLGANTFGGYFASPPVTIVDKGTPNGTIVGNPTNGGAPGNGVTAWYGMSNAAVTGTSKRMLIVYNKYMGSAAGVSNLMAKDMKSVQLVPEAKVVTVGPLEKVPGKPAKGYSLNSCTVDSGTAEAPTTVGCTSWAWTKADIALSDVDAPELVGMYTNKKVALADITRKAIGMQGFAVAVNNKFYTALQAYQVSTGALPASCTPVAPATSVYTEACQPSISSAQYASLVTKDGGIKSAAGFIPGSLEALVLARRDDLSGTQAASQIFFGKSVCNAKDPKSKINLGGAMVATNETDFTNKVATAGSLIVNHNVQSSAVESDLARTDAYAIGVITLAKGASSTYKFVKLDGMSPNFAKNGTSTLATTTLRNNMINGSWPFQVVSYVMYPTAAAASGQAKAGLIGKFQADMSDSTLHNLTAISYFNGSDATKVSLVHRANDKVSGNVTFNNCAPLTFK